MPKRTDIKSVLIIGAGPIVIGQACEFDYSGAQACKSLREEGYRVILVNSNPATIMTDPDTADATYIEPITAEFVRRVIEKERPDAILPTMGGQTALNVGLELDADGTLEEFGVEMIGAKPEVIEKAEDRDKFRAAMEKLGLDMPRSAIAHNMEEAHEALKDIGLPAVVRPSFTLGGKGGGIAFNKEEFEQIASHGIKLSPNSQVLIDESILGWKEYEMEVVRDSADNCIIVCSIENVDPMGVHTGDSITVAPALTLTDKEYQIMRNASLEVLREIGVDTGGSNVQFAVHPETGRLIVIEMNPRVSRSSALASKATGFPIAKVAAKLAVGYTLDELENDITGDIPASFEPTIDYVVTKIPRFTFEKFPKTDPLLGTSMQSVGEAMSIGRNFQESLQKALRSLEIGLSGLDEVTIPNVTDSEQKGAIRAALSRQTPGRLGIIAQAFRYGMELKEIQRITKFDPWFLSQIEEIITTENTLRENGLPKTTDECLRLKQMGFGDARLAELTSQSPKEVRAYRRNLGVKPVYKRIDSCAAEFKSPTPYLYSTYEREQAGLPTCEAGPTDKKKVIILGGGPNRIGQGIEFDYCCVHAAFALQEIDIEAIIVNCNPETVSTDYDTADRLYFEPLTVENVLSIVQKEQEKGEVLGVIVQFGGQTPLKIAAALEAEGVPILGTTVDSIDLAEDRERFQQLVQKLKLLQPDNDIAFSAEEAIEKVDALGFPVVVRPSYVLGGRGMEIVYNHDALRRYVTEACVVSPDEPVLIDKFLHGAIEIDVDAICDGEQVYIAAIMEHIEEAGVHSGDSSCALPPHSLSKEIIAELERQTEALAKALNVRGLMNIQFAVQKDKIYLIEVNPRASRTVPFVAKATEVPVAKIAAKVMAGRKLSEFDLTKNPCGKVSIKSPVFPFDRFIANDNVLGPEMRSTGEVMGIGDSFGGAFARAQIAASNGLPKAGTVFVSVKDEDKPNIVEPVQKMLSLGYRVIATYGNAKFLNEHGVGVGQINKVQDGQPHIVDAIINGQVQLVLNTTEEGQAVEDSAVMRRAAVQNSTPYFTTLSAIEAAVEGMEKIRAEDLRITRLQKSA